MKLSLNYFTNFCMRIKYIMIMIIIIIIIMIIIRVIYITLLSSQ